MDQFKFIEPNRKQDKSLMNYLDQCPIKECNSVNLSTDLSNQERITTCSKCGFMAPLDKFRKDI